MADSDRNDVQTADGEPRRNFLVEFSALAIGAITGLAGLLSGLIVYLDPLLRKNKPPLLYRQGDGGGGGDGFLRVASLDAIPDDGVPRRFPVIADQIDAWNFSPDVPIGSVYIRRESGEEKPVALHSTCPHAGCSVSYAADPDPQQAAFHCPCHNSSFNIDGSKRESAGVQNPSPRELDELEVDVRDNEIWVKFEDYYTGIHEKKAKL